MWPKHLFQNESTDGQGGGSGDFQTLIPTEFRGHPSLEPIKDMSGLVKSYISAQEMVGKNKVVVPGEGAKPEEWNEFFGKLGRPEAPEKYGLAKPTDLPEGLGLDDKFVGNLAKMFHDAGLTQRQANAFFSKYTDTVKNEFTEAAKEANLRSAEQKAELQREWGAAYDTKVDTAKRAVRAFLGEKESQWLDKQGLSTDPNMIRVFASIGEKLGEPRQDGNNDTGGGFGPITPAVAQAEIQQKLSDKDFTDMYFDRAHPRHGWAVEQMMRLHKMANPQ